MKIIFTLGNPDEKYKFTRHNAGFLLADYIISTENLSHKFEKKFNAVIAKNEDCLIVMPQTYMNLSGEAVEKVMTFYKAETKDILIVFDDISLDLGKIRFRSSGEDGGHNGVKSVANALKTPAFDRLKIGIGPQPPFMKSEAWVLGKFGENEIETLKKTIEGCYEAVKFWTKLGISEAQNKYNGIYFG